MLAPITHILPLTTIRRERLLPVSGKVVVRKGQKVSATDVIAEVRLAPEHLQLDIARGLGLREEQADHHLKCKAGDRLAQGDLVAGPVGLTQRVVRAPRNARVIVAGGGQVLLEIEGQPFELKAGLPGEVVELVADRGAVIEATGSLIQGVWGNGRMDFGLMYVLARSPDEILTSDRLDVSLRGSVVVAGYCQDAEVLKAGSNLPLRGMILASMDPSLQSAALKARFPIVVIDGFGHLPMNPAAYKLLTTNERREMAINAEPWDRFTGNRPEVVIPLPATGQPPLPHETGIFSTGQQVRVIRSPFTGQIGTLIELPEGMMPLANGLLIQAGVVRMEKGEEAVIPLANLEVLE